MGRKAQGKRIAKGSNQLGRALIKKNTTTRRVRVANPNTDAVRLLL